MPVKSISVLLVLVCTTLVCVHALTDQEIAESVQSKIDPTADPCKSFYDYACGNWENNFQLPSDRQRYSLSSDGIGDDIEQSLQLILEENWPTLAPFYRSCMNTTRRDYVAPSHVAAAVTHVSTIIDMTSLFAAVGRLHRQNVNVLFNPMIAPNLNTPKSMALFLSQGGLGLYTPSDYDDEQLLAQYQKHIQQSFILAGWTQAQAQQISQSVLVVERFLANSSLAPVALRDPVALHNPMTIAQLSSLAPGIPTSAWNVYFVAMGLPNTTNSIWNTAIDVRTPLFFSNMSNIFSVVSGEQLRHYLQWSLLNNLAPNSFTSLVNENFNFYGKQLNGQQDITPLWRRCIASTDQSVGFLLSRYWVMNKFSAQSKAIGETMVANIKDVFLNELPSISWLDNSTELGAAKKLNLLEDMVGYPDEWPDLSSLCLNEQEYLENIEQATQFAMNDSINSFYKPTDRKKWEMTPSTINAYYSPETNVIVIPAGIMQPGFFFDESYPNSMRYGGLGGVIGHEITHSCDDEGKNYNAFGQLQDWWSPQSLAAFNQRAACVVNLYSNYQILPGVFINGNLTLGENLADLGGVKFAYKAFMKEQKAHPERTIIKDLTPQQLFFVNYALTWCEKDTPEYIRNKVKNDPHSPAKARVDLPLSQLDQFAEAFSCPVNSPMNPTNKCSVW